MRCSSTPLKGGGGGTVTPLDGRAMMTREDWRRSWPAWLRGTAFGFPIGALPAGGAEIPTFLSYATERRLTKHPEEFGHGAIEGVAGPEAANNAAAAGVLVPLLTIGLPDLGDRGGDAHRVPVLRPAARTAAVQRVRPLVVVDGRAGGPHVDHEAEIGLVVSHAKCGRRHDRLQPVGPQVLDALARLRVELPVVGGNVVALADEEVRETGDRLDGGGVDDPGARQQGEVLVHPRV